MMICTYVCASRIDSDDGKGNGVNGDGGEVTAMKMEMVMMMKVVIRMVMAVMMVLAAVIAIIS